MALMYTRIGQASLMWRLHVFKYHASLGSKHCRMAAGAIGWIGSLVFKYARSQQPGGDGYMYALHVALGQQGLLAIEAWLLGWLMCITTGREGNILMEVNAASKKIAW